jgi:hypothetical protein
MRSIVERLVSRRLAPVAEPLDRLKPHTAAIQNDLLSRGSAEAATGKTTRGAPKASGWSSLVKRLGGDEDA